METIIEKLNRSIGYSKDIPSVTDWETLSKKEEQDPIYYCRAIAINPPPHFSKSVKWERRASKSYIIIKIRDKALFLPYQLIGISTTIQKSNWIKGLKEDWDSEGALPILDEIYNSAIEFLLNYSLDIFKKSGLILEPPDINPCKDASIDLSWRTPKARLLINIRKVDEEILAYFYGDYYKNELPIKGYVRINGISEHLAIWMKSLI